MGAKVTVQARLADGTPVPGARVLGVNHDAWSSKHKEWSGTTNDQGSHTWENMDTGTLGDRYTFRAEHLDPKQGTMMGEVSQRIKTDAEIVITLSKDGGKKEDGEKK